VRILSITAGPAGMYCGSCIRDNALAAELIRQGHDVTLVPLYTPTKTDEPNVSYRRVFFGGISVYLEQHVPLFRKTPRFLDKLWDSGWALAAAARGSVSNRGEDLGALTISILRGAGGHQRKELDKLLEWLVTQPRPDIVNLSYALILGLARPLREALQCPLVCTLQGEDLFLDSMGNEHRAEALRLIREHARHVDAFLAVSEYYARFMAGYLGIPAGKIHVAPLGVNLDGLAPAPRDPARPFTIGYFARITPEKGLHTLAEAYRVLRQELGLPPARLEAAGYLAPQERKYLADLESRLSVWGLRGEFRYHGEVDRAGKIRFLQSLDVMSVPASYAEPKGLSILEAMACGVPLVQPRIGAYPEMLEKTGGGLLVDEGGLAVGIFELWKQSELRARLGQAGAEGVRRHYSVDQEAARVLEIYRTVGVCAG
jgi:glycosyltransferase involved in cell wall biosynthesis